MWLWLLAKLTNEGSLTRYSSKKCNTEALIIGTRIWAYIFKYYRDYSGDLRIFFFSYNYPCTRTLLEDSKRLTFRFVSLGGVPVVSVVGVVVDILVVAGLVVELEIKRGIKTGFLEVDGSMGLKPYSMDISVWPGLVRVCGLGRTGWVGCGGLFNVFGKFFLWPRIGFSWLFGWTLGWETCNGAGAGRG